MSVIQIRKAQREGARLVIGLAGISGSGKTYSAIQLAYGLANKQAHKVGFLDTENRRGSLYADSLPEPFLIGDLYAPFSPQRYIEAIHEFQKAGVEVLVIDSVTHEWEGSGGCEEIAQNTNSKMANWKLAKAEHKRFMNAMLQCDMHIIACIRAREKVDFTNPKEPRSLGVQPIQEKNFMFEMTASLMMWEGGKEHQILKCPDELMSIFGRERGYITTQDGENLRAWVDGAKSLNPAVESAKNRLLSITEMGMAALQDAWKELPPDIRKAISPSGKCPDDLKAAAKAYDDHRSQAAAPANMPDCIADLNASIVTTAQVDAPADDHF